MTYIGIDYGLGKTNIDHATGIRYGVISAHNIGQVWYDDAQPVYGSPTCPKCGNTAIEIPSHTESSDPPGQWVSTIQDVPDAYEAYETLGGNCPDFACELCEILFDASENESEVQGFEYSDEDYRLTQGSDDSDVFVLMSPFYTFAQFCSPCAPGAGYLMNPIADGVKTYCLPADWFEDGKAPYPVYRVADDTLVTE